ncbi:NAD-binding protein [Halococcus sp. IIIV-5B]|uniref:NAD-binding protein n=1 Tax=Halococcus sp. IIIV-5B TaxID=2321230 RepID=UPI000E76E36F|nr:NAD-binding protein [Halococcus sp. IIIV-5B]RJT01437.1 potassium transporter TrkA [Halococcus sp. IIIV-5B]
MVAVVVVVDRGGPIGGALASRIVDDTGQVIFLDGNEHAVERASDAGVDARTVDSSRAGVFDGDGIERADLGLVVSPEDGHNLLVGQFLRLRGVERVVGLVNDPANLDAFAGAGIEPVCATSTLTGVLDARRREPRVGVRSGTTETTVEPHETDEPSRTDDRERLRSDGGRVRPSG